MSGRGSSRRHDAPRTSGGGRKDGGSGGRNGGSGRGDKRDGGRGGDRGRGRDRDRGRDGGSGKRKPTREPSTATEDEYSYFYEYSDYTESEAFVSALESFRDGTTSKGQSGKGGSNTGKHKGLTDEQDEWVTTAQVHVRGGGGNDRRDRGGGRDRRREPESSGSGFSDDDRDGRGGRGGRDGARGDARGSGRGGRDRDTGDDAGSTPTGPSRVKPERGGSTAGGRTGGTGRGASATPTTARAGPTTARTTQPRKVPTPPAPPEDNSSKLALYSMIAVLIFGCVCYGPFIILGFVAAGAGENINANATDWSGSGSAPSPCDFGSDALGSMSGSAEALNCDMETACGSLQSWLRLVAITLIVYIVFAACAIFFGTKNPGDTKVRAGVGCLACCYCIFFLVVLIIGATRTGRAGTMGCKYFNPMVWKTACATVIICFVCGFGFNGGLVRKGGGGGPE